MICWVIWAHKLSQISSWLLPQMILAEVFWWSTWKNYFTLKWRCSVRHLKWLNGCLAPGLVWANEVHIWAEECCVVEVGDHPLHCQGITHLYHGATLYSPKELDPDNVAVQAEQVEDFGSIHLVRVEPIYHANTSLVLWVKRYNHWIVIFFDGLFPQLAGARVP